ncbi:VOC family protein [Paenibacillus sp. HJGM_3]
MAAKEIDTAYAILRDTGVTVSDIVTHGNGHRQFNITDPEGIS